MMKKRELYVSPNVKIIALGTDVVKTSGETVSEWNSTAWNKWNSSWENENKGGE